MVAVKAKKIWFNGKLVSWDKAQVHVLTHSLHYGSAVFEGMRCYNTDKGPAIFRLRDHVTRLFNSAKIYLMPLPYSAEQVAKACKEIVKANGFKECYIRPIAFYGFGYMGLNPRGNPVNLAIACWPWGPYLGKEALDKGVRIKVSSWRRIDPVMLPNQAKASGNYINSILAKLEATQDGFDEAIMLNFEGHVVDGPGENFFMARDNKLITPPLSDGILDGITRKSVMKIASDLGIKVVEQEISVDEMFLADEAFFTGTAAEITPIREIDGRTIGLGKKGPLTDRIQKKFFDTVKGLETRYREWLDFV